MINIDTIKKELLKAGWAQKDIDHVLAGLKEKKSEV